MKVIAKVNSKICLNSKAEALILIIVVLFAESPAALAYMQGDARFRSLSRTAKMEFLWLRSAERQSSISRFEKNESRLAVGG